MALLVAGVLVAQERVETGLQLRMDERLGAPGERVPGTRSGAQVTDDAELSSTSESAVPLLRGLSLQLTSGIRFDDNVYRTDRNEERDTVIVLRPSVYLNGRAGRHDVRLGYEADIERYQRLGSENHFNHRFLANTDLDLSRILKSRLYAELEYGTDPRGDLTTRPSAGGEPDRWRRHAIGGSVTLGRRIARAQFSLDYGVEGVRYLNNGQQDRDFDERDLGLTARYNLGPRYSLLAEVGGAWIDYLSPVSTLDVREYTALVGVEWEATAKTRGVVKVGLRHLDFHDLSRPSISGFNWDARVNWAPRTYSQFTAYTSREVTDGAFGGDAGSGTAISDVFGLRWRYGFSERLTLDTGLERAVSTFQDGGDDDFMNYDAGLRYKLTRWADLFGEWTYRTRSSASGGYEAGGVFIGVDMRFDRPFGR